MMDCRRLIRVVGGVLVCFAAQGATRLSAQGRNLPRPVAFLSVGPATNDIFGIRTGLMASLRFDLRLDRLVIAELGMGYLRLPDYQGRTYRFLLPEVSFQAEAPLPVRPFVGLGVGWAETMGSNAGYGLVPSLHAVAGARLALGARWVIRGEARVRTLDPIGHSGEWTIGVGRKL